MNNSKCLLTLASLVIGAGCQSNHTRASNTVHGTLPNSQVTYTVEIIPNPRLSATSREGDKSGEVYSSNIVAVYIHHPGGSNAAGTNSNSIEARSIKK
jgi:hypothetical protein